MDQTTEEITGCGGTAAKHGFANPPDPLGPLGTGAAAFQLIRNFWTETAIRPGFDHHRPAAFPAVDDPEQIAALRTAGLIIEAHQIARNALNKAERAQPGMGGEERLQFIRNQGLARNPEERPGQLELRLSSFPGGSFRGRRGFLKPFVCGPQGLAGLPDQ